MGSELGGADPAHHQRRGLEEPAFGQPRQAHRPPQPEHCAKPRPIGPPKTLEETVFRQCGQKGGVKHNQPQRHDLHRHGGNGRARDAQLGRAQIAKDQGPVQQHIQRHRRHRDPQHDLRALQGREIAFQHHHQKRGAHAKPGNPQVLLRQCRDLFLLAQGQENGPRPPEHRIGQRRKQDRQPQPHPRHTAHLPLIALGIRGGDHRHHRLGETRPQNEDREKAGRAQDPRRQGQNPIPAQHDRVGQMQDKLRHMTADQGQTQGKGCARMKEIGGNLVHLPDLSAEPPPGKHPARRGWPAFQAKATRAAATGPPQQRPSPR